MLHANASCLLGVEKTQVVVMTMCFVQAAMPESHWTIMERASSGWSVKSAVRGSTASVHLETMPLVQSTSAENVLTDPYSLCITIQVAVVAPVCYFAMLLHKT